MGETETMSDQGTTLNMKYGSATPEANVSAVSWAAIFAGAAATAALSLILLELGAGMGLSSISPWLNEGVSAGTARSGAFLWLALIAIISSSIGGYMAGRLRTKWVNVHTDEVFFRDTAHGFLAWSVAFVITAGFLASASAAMVGAGIRNMDTTRGQTVSADPNRYFVDSMFRSSQAPPANDETARTEVGLIFAHVIAQRQLDDPDNNYMAQLVSTKTGIPPAEAEQRVTNAFNQAQQAADDARKAIAHSLYWIFVGLLLGAFCASFGATIGGKQRDHMRV